MGEIIIDGIWRFFANVPCESQAVVDQSTLLTVANGAGDKNPRSRMER